MDRSNECSSGNEHHEKCKTNRFHDMALLNDTWEQPPCGAERTKMDIQSPHLSIPPFLRKAPQWNFGNSKWDWVTLESVGTKLMARLPAASLGNGEQLPIDEQRRPGRYRPGSKYGLLQFVTLRLWIQGGISNGVYRAGRVNRYARTVSTSTTTGHDSLCTWSTS